MLPAKGEWGASFLSRVNGFSSRGGRMGQSECGLSDGSSRLSTCANRMQISLDSGVGEKDC